MNAVNRQRAVLAALLIALGVSTPVLAHAVSPAATAADEVTALEAAIATLNKDKQQSAAAFQAYEALGAFYEARGDRKNANKTYTRTIAAFDKGKFQLNGGPEATAAARAELMLLTPHYDAFMATKIVPNPKLKPDKQMAFVVSQVKAMMDVVFGPEKETVAPDGVRRTLRANGMYDQYAARVGKYGSKWTYLAYLNRARMLLYLAATIYKAPAPPDMSKDESAAFDEFVASFGKQVEDRALKSLVEVLKDADAKGVSDPAVTQIRGVLHTYLPKEFPLPDAGASAATPVPAP